MRHSRPFRKNPDIDEAPTAYQVRRAAKNSRKVLPMPGKSFSAQELQDLKAWFKARGADAVLAEGAGLRVIADVDNIDDVVPNYVHEKKLARSRLAQEARDAADRERRVETEKRLSDSPAASWVQHTFSAVNAFNKATLARYIDGTDRTFQGLLSGTFLEGALSLGFSEEQLRSWSGEELLKAIKHAYDASLRENPEPTPSIRFVYGARRLARGGFAPVVAQHGPGRSAHEHGGWVAQGYDEDVALAVAKEHAEELASQYIGDWNIEIVPEERGNPRRRRKAVAGIFGEEDEEAVVMPEASRRNPAVVDEPGSPIAELAKKLDHRFLWSTRKAGELVKNNYIRFVTDRGAEPTVWKVITHPKHDLIDGDPIVICQIKSLHDGTIRKREYWFRSEEVYVDV
jgi:hypothetical protein